MDVGIAIAIGLALLVAVLIRATMTLADISHSLEKIADTKQEVKVSVSAPQSAMTKAEQTEPDDADLAAVIAIARAALDGALPIA